MVDFTADTPFEYKGWEKIKKFKDRKPLHKRDEEDQFNYVYDKRVVIRGLFQDFEDQGEELYKF